MPVQIDVFDFKCFNRLKNGFDFDRNLSEFTPNLVGNVGEKLKVEYKVNIQQSAYTEGSEEWTLINGGGLKQIERSSGSFLDDDIQVGDVYLYYDDWADRRNVASLYTGQVEFISSDGLILQYSVLTGTDPASATVTNAGMSFNLSAIAPNPETANNNGAVFVRFGLIGNDETFNFLSKTTGAQQVYYVGSLLRDDIERDAISLGTIKDWVSGFMKVTFTTNLTDFRGAQYNVSHEFVLNPFYIIAFREFIETNTLPDLFAGDNSIKYALELEFRKTLTNTGSGKTQLFDGLEGFVGWYNESFNGLNPDYEILSISYEDTGTTDPLEAININLTTKATIVVSKLSGAITDYSCGVYLFKVPDSEDDYIGTTTDLIDNFLLKSEIVSSPDTISANVTTSLSGGDLIIEYIIDYSTADKLRLTTEDEYILAIQVEDSTLSAGNSDRIMLLADFRNYIDVDFLADFIDAPQYNFLTHDKTLGTGASTTIVANEDGILLNAIIGSNTLRDVIINGITLNLLAYNEAENKSFNLDTFVFNIGDPVIAGGLQQIEITGTRGYPLPSGDIFNFANIETLGQSGDDQQFQIQVGQKIRWQDWIFNPNVDNAFFNSLFPNNNLNFKSSNYSDENGYVIKLALVVNVTGVDDLGRTITGDFIEYGGDLEVLDYDENEPSDTVTGIIETFDAESGQSLGGGVLFNGKDTLFRCTWENADLISYGIHRIEPSLNGGDGIFELSSVLPSVNNNLLKPLDGETLLKFTLIGSDLTTECLIDGSLIQEGVDYKLSARVGNKF